MKTVSYTEFGPAETVLKLGEMDRPAPGPGEVLVRLAYSGVNPSDAKARAGGRPGVPKPPFPVIIPHSDGAGVIEAVGEGVDAARLGERVWLWNGQWQRAFGTAAQYIALPSAQAVPLPEDVSLETGAMLGIPGLTAARAVFGGGEVAGRTVLISGGAGSVGHIAVQLARRAGARVIATASKGARNRVLEAGAQTCLDYADPDLGAQVMQATDGYGIDRAVEVEFGRNAALLGEVMRPNATICAYGSGQDMTPVLPFGPYLFKALTIEIVLIYILDDPARQAAIARLHDALAAGALDVACHAIVPMDQAARAHEMVMTPGRAGGVLLDVS